MGDAMRVLDAADPADALVVAAAIEGAAEAMKNRDKSLAVMVANAMNGHAPE